MKGTSGNGNEWGMTGHLVPVESLQHGQPVHLAPHRVDGRTVGRHVIDVVVESAHAPTDVRGDETHIVLDYAADPHLLGAKPGMTGCVVFERSDRVLVLGRPMAWPAVAA